MSPTRTDMKIVMTLLVRDEQDALRANIEFHRAQGVDFFIATDNRSEDATPGILKEYEREGLLHYIWEGDDDYNQTEWVTRMARLAATDFGADWVINNDADEFWWPVSGSLRSTFEEVGPEYNIVRAQRTNFVPVEEEEEVFYRHMVFREKASLNAKGKPLPPKVAHRASPEVTVGQGNHGVYGMGELRVLDGVIEIFHFPIRSYEQFTNKIVKGGQAYERNKTLPADTGRTWRALYKQYQRDKLVPYYRKQQYGVRRIEKEMRKGTLLADHRLARYLEGLGCPGAGPQAG